MMRKKNSIRGIIVLALVAAMGCSTGSTDVNRRDGQIEEENLSARNANRDAAGPDGASGVASEPSASLKNQTEGRIQLDGIPAEAVFSVRSPRFKLKNGLPVVSVSVFADDQLIRRCDIENLEDGVCVQEAPLEPGAHTVMLRMLAQNPETMSTSSCPRADGSSGSCEYDQSLKLSIVLGEHVTIDLAKRGRAEDLSACLTRSGGYEAPADNCIARLLEYAAAPSCTSEDLQNALSLARSSRVLCADASLDGSDARGLLFYAEKAHFQPSVSRCYSPDTLQQKIPPIYSGYSNGPSWPPGTIESSSWDWSRNSFPRGHDAVELTGAEHLSTQIDALERSLQRLQMVEGLFGAFMDKTRRDALLDMAARAPWSLDPMTVEGHRNYVIVRSGLENNGQTPAGKAYLQFAARNAFSDASLHCGMPEVSSYFVFMLLGDQHLSRGDYKTIQAMIKRTPIDKSLETCGHAFSHRQKSSIPIATRLRWLAEYECSTDNRHEELLGKELSSEIGVMQRNRESRRLADALKKDYADCVVR